MCGPVRYPSSRERSGGQVAHHQAARTGARSFANRYGFSKSGISHWLNKGGIPTLKAWLTIALHGGIGLDKLFAGDVEGWELPLTPVQMSIELPESPRAGIKSRELDWDSIRVQLQVMLKEPEPVSVHEASERVGVDRKNLYLRANLETRALADRYLRHRASIGEQRQARLQAQIGDVLDERLAAGYEGMSARDCRRASKTTQRCALNFTQAL